MKYKNILTISLVMLTAVLIGVAVIEPASKQFLWLQPLTPVIVISGFFTFLVATSLFVFVVVNNIKKQ